MVRTVLVVDDEAGIVDSLSEVLSEEGFAVVIARNGKDALRKIAEARPDLVLLDYMMPIMDGRDTLRALQADDALRDLPVIMMSAVPCNSLPPDCQPTAFLRKPFQIVALMHEIERLLARTTSA